MSVWWSVGLTAAGITGWWLAGSGPRWAPWGWTVAMAVQPFWIAFAIVGRQWGFIVAGLFYAAVAARNWRRARRPQHGFASPTWDATVDEPRRPVHVCPDERHACPIPVAADPPSGLGSALRGFDEALKGAPPALTRPLEGP